MNNPENPDSGSTPSSPDASANLYPTILPILDEAVLHAKAGKPIKEFEELTKKIIGFLDHETLEITIRWPRSLGHPQSSDFRKCFLIWVSNTETGLQGVPGSGMAFPFKVLEAFLLNQTPQIKSFEENDYVLKYRTFIVDTSKNTGGGKNMPYATGVWLDEDVPWVAPDGSPLQHLPKIMPEMMTFRKTGLTVLPPFGVTTNPQ